MNHYQNILFDVGRVILAGLLIIAGFLMISFLLSSIEINTVEAKGTDFSSSPLASDMSDSPNVVTSTLAAAVNGSGQTIDFAINASNESIDTLSSATTQTSKTIVNGTKQGAGATARGIGTGIAFTGRMIGNTVGFVIGIPSNMLGVVARAPLINTVIRPSDHQDVPIIDPNSPELLAALTALPPTAEAPSNQVAQQNTGDGPVWPIHGRITTEFGVNHRPYQDTHTGLDISDGQRSGVTPVKPFRTGQVIETIHSRYGLGNHVIVDHGNGVTSVYAHLHSISVRVGQQVNLDTVLGLEGTTGLSTGTHLHFEIRVNGQAANPHKFISGQP